MKKIGDIIRSHRTAIGLTQEELGTKVHVSKQAVSKWETGKTMPDIEMIRKLCEILNIDKDEILGKTIEDNKKKGIGLKICIIITAICILVTFLISLNPSAVFDFIKNRAQWGVAYVWIYCDGEVISTDEYSVSAVEAGMSPRSCEDLDLAYGFAIDYGDVHGTIKLFDKYEIDFGFMNLNNWHNVQIRLDVSTDGGVLSVTQTVSYKSIGTFDAFVTNEEATSNKISVYQYT